MEKYNYTLKSSTLLPFEDTYSQTIEIDFKNEKYKCYLITRNRTTSIENGGNPTPVEVLVIEGLREELSASDIQTIKGFLPLPTSVLNPFCYQKDGLFWVGKTSFEKYPSERDMHRAYLACCPDDSSYFDAANNKTYVYMWKRRYEVVDHDEKKIYYEVLRDKGQIWDKEIFEEYQKGSDILIEGLFYASMDSDKSLPLMYEMRGTLQIKKENGVDKQIWDVVTGLPGKDKNFNTDDTFPNFLYHAMIFPKENVKWEAVRKENQ